MTDESKDLVRQESKSLMRPVVSLKEIQETQQQMEELIKGGLSKGIDFGKIPGTPKPTLLKPGAEKILRWFNCYAQYNIFSEDHDADKTNIYEGDTWVWDEIQKKRVKTGQREKQESTGYHNYKLQCHLISRATGEIVGTGVGSCSTAESKYISRPNDIENTVLKMAKKRSLIDAVLATFALSDRFTQDRGDRDVDADKAKKTPPPKEKQPSSLALTKEEAQAMIGEMFDLKEEKAFLTEITTFEKEVDGQMKFVGGVDSLKRMSEKQFNYVAPAIQAKYQRFLKSKEDNNA